MDPSDSNNNIGQALVPVGTRWKQQASQNPDESVEVY